MSQRRYQRSGRQEGNGQSYRGRKGYTYPRRHPQPLSPVGQVLVNTALDVMGALVTTAAIAQYLEVPLLRVCLIVCLGVAGFDLVFRTSLHQAFVWLVVLPKKVSRKRKAPTVASARGAEPLPPEPPVGTLSEAV